MTKFAEHILIPIHFGDLNDAVLDSTSIGRSRLVRQGKGLKGITISLSFSQLLPSSIVLELVCPHLAIVHQDQQ